MKKYKLIKDYPGCDCDLGTIVQYQDRTYPPYFDIKTGIRYSHEIVEKYPEFWEEVVEKDYEILEIDGYSGRYFLNPETGYMAYGGNGDGMYNAEHYLNSGYHHYIVSVKRLSDGEIFTVGDTIHSNDFKPTKLEKITIRDNGSIAMWGKYHSNMLGEIGLASCRIKQPLFTTEDGVDIYKGDIAVPLDPKTFRIFAPTSYNTGESIRFGNYLYFSTKEATEEYILMNKPCLSINDIKRLRAENMGLVQKDLVELVKSKL